MNSLVVLYRILRKFYKGLKRIEKFYGKTVYHGLAFLGVHIFPVVGGIASFYTQYFLCRDHNESCFANQKSYIIGSSFLIAISILFQLLYTLYVYLIWKKGIWPLVYEFKYSRHDEIKACLCWIVLALSTWNTIRCHKNFGKFMEFYIQYEPPPPEFESGRKLVIRESSSMAPPPEFKFDRKLVKRESSSMAKHSHIV
ncbi:hypothetical protein GLOIN_2v1479005 [Rhizophagus irregularis DAOM 181602=DAOM 197198]|uniref:Uncharacterized protein n=1 Tax=Rhizophagus irregularis (strain DAOM 181602 / DAOM 197198 / MUCL 43194) TaxID=747089 RepID=A0A2P4PZ59_RHIID|nr:hypothetical protein GLOIN_2v1479005 [Rhizophagus irregularis DAOM 181602=DAOM 197198]POG70687.1 hypothetical protein GLOIN_2v1479005 [Rhizophagus irregularis DAOM 181602=DAOM 197198]|eukprot:XP_025177553.1 hypothetical protein GLOIN_2v1479005 [Rhizophagus irregularis DAOM 181602=DAOM 197198]